MSPPRRPALLPALALLAGVSVTLAGTFACHRPTVGTAALLLAVLARHGRRRSATLAACGFACGLLLGDAARDAATQRTADWFGRDGERVEADVAGRLLASPEIGQHGERLLTLVAPPPRRPNLPQATVSVRVAASPADALHALDALTAGDRARIWCRMPRPARERELAPLSCAVKSARLVEPLERSDPSVRGAIDRARRLARVRLDRSLGTEGERRALAGALLLGERGRLEPSTWRTLRDAGLAHLVAISGLHVGLLFLPWAIALRWIRLPGTAAAALLAVLSAGFATLVGAPPSVVRATAGIAAWGFGRAIGRDGDALNGLAVAAAAIVVVRPSLLAHAGFQLSFAATAAILLFARPLTQALPGPRWLAASLAVSAAAYAGTAPFVAWWFGRLAPVALLSNLAAAPLCAALLASGAAVILLGPRAGCDVMLAAALDLLLALAARAAELDGGSFAVARAPTLWVVVSCVALAVAAFGVGPAPARRAARTLAAVGLLGLHVGPPPPRLPHAVTPLEVTVLDVGQGQSVLIRAAGGRAVLVDAGGSATARYDPGERVVLPELLARCGPWLDVLVVSHADVDHAAGAFALLREIRLGELWLPPGWHIEPRLRELAERARLRGAAVVLAESGLRDARRGLEVNVLAPDRRMPSDIRNDRSIVVAIGAGGARLLVPGDLQAAGEAALLSASGELSLRAEMLVVAHHGSASATSEAFLERVRPRLAVISCGRRNVFRHPAPQVLERLHAAGIGVLRTDIHGRVRARLGAGVACVETQRSTLDDHERNGDEREDEDRQQQ